MLKKIASAVFVSAIALALAAPVASACPGMNKSVNKEQKDDQGVVAQKDRASDRKQEQKKARKDKSEKKVAKAEKEQKKPIN